MPSQAIAGFNCRVSISIDGGTTYLVIGESRDATLNISQNEIEATSFDSAGWSEYIPGLKEWTVDIEALYIESNTAQDNLYASLVNGTTTKLKLVPKTGTGITGFEGSAFVTSWEINPTPDDAVAISVSFRGTGNLTTFVST